MGLADITTRRPFDKIDLRAIYKNVITSRGFSLRQDPNGHGTGPGDGLRGHSHLPQPWTGDRQNP